LVVRGDVGDCREWLSHLSVTPDAASSPRLLDAGCGTGGALRWLAHYGRPFGFDQHPVALQLAGDKAFRDWSALMVARSPLRQKVFPS